ncbi:MAG: peroxidase [Gammaproteobacteria bacterium]|nr:peroxidase [Gammaproteobacteria bacterium]
MSIDLQDIQGNIVKGYAQYDYPKARYVFYHIRNEVAGRAFVKGIAPLVTTGIPWNKKAKPNAADAPPPATTNIAFTYMGLKMLGVPRKSLQTFPEEFVMGMKLRKDILGDDGPSDPRHWDRIWRDTSVHLWISINGRDPASIETRYQEISHLVAESDGGIIQLSGHHGPDGSTDLPYQSASLIYKNGIPQAREHFGYRDGIGEPYFMASSGHPNRVIGGGKPTRGDPATRKGWEPLETGEFILGHRDEAFETPIAPQPPLLAFNGTFMVYRKLHENVGSFNRYLDTVGENYPGGKELLAAKFSGRWRSSGAPVTRFPTNATAETFEFQLNEAEARLYAERENPSKEAKEAYVALRTQMAAFDYNHDLEGSRCPLGAHIRRINPRGALEHGKEAFNTPGALTNRRRILRRGLPYGEVADDSRDDGDHGIIFIAINASISRQFEFVQQQWINYGNDFKLANDKDPLTGNHGVDSNQQPTGRMILQGNSTATENPFFCAGIPRFVETRGGDYFFIPSLTALHMLSNGTVDPT